MADGGILLLGVDENNGAFDVTGVEDPNGVASALHSACAEVEPPLRPRISLIEHEPGVIVIAAELAATPRSQRPPYRRQDGPYNGSFVRVGDADERLRQPEVDEMLAAKTSTDHSARPGPDGATVDDEQVDALVGQLRVDGYRVPDDPQELLARWQAIADGRPTLAGLLALGADPAAFTPAARLAYRVEPGEKAAGRKRFEGAAHIEGRIGEIIEATLARLAGDLDTSQIVGRDGQVYDELDVPAEALREIIANALLHRSLTEAQSASSVVVTVNPLAVTVQSPGGLHVATDLSELGLSPLSQVRNLTLVRLCQYLRTPRGARIVENQASGIRAADEACRQAGTPPALFFDFPARFDVVLIRHPIDVAAARAAP